MKYKIIKNPNKNEYDKISQLVVANNGYCPCVIEQNNDTMCICKDFKEQNEEGFCHCRRFKKIKGGITMDKNTILFTSLREGAQIPTKKDEDAGYDLYACFDDEFIIIQPHTSALIPTGIASAFSDDWVAVLKERGSTGVRSIKTGAGIIDSGFRNEWKICLYNGNDKPILITKETNEETLKILEDDYMVYPYHKALCQILFLPVPKLNVKEVTYEEILNIDSQRGLGMLGSSGK